MVKGFLIATLAISQPAITDAQTVTMEELVQRIELVERENADLRAQLRQLRDAPATPAAAMREPRVATVARPPFNSPMVAHSVPTPTHLWGAYIGVGIGAAGTRFRVEAAPFETISPSGPGFGGQLGWRRHRGALVTGLELEVLLPVDQAGSFPSSVTFETGLTGRLKGQLGYATGPALFYGIGGFQISEVQFLRDRDAPGITQSGFLYGLGAEARISSTLSLAIEAVEARLGSIPNVSSVSNRGRTIMFRLNHQLP